MLPRNQRLLCKPNVPLLYTGEPLLSQSPVMCPGAQSDDTADFTYRVITQLLSAYDSDTLNVLVRTRAPYLSALFDVIAAGYPNIQLDQWTNDADRSFSYIEAAITYHYNLIVCERTAIDPMFLRYAWSRGCLVLHIGQIVFSPMYDMWTPTVFSGAAAREDRVRIELLPDTVGPAVKDKSLFIPSSGYFQPPSLTGRGLTNIRIFG